MKIFLDGLWDQMNIVTQEMNKTSTREPRINRSYSKYIPSEKNKPRPANPTNS